MPAAPAIQRSAPGEGPAFRGMQATLPPQLASTELEQQGFRAEIQVLSERLDSMDYFELLGVERDASGPIVQAAFFQLAKRWHPDRMSADLSDLKDAAGRVFARMSEAHQVLSNDEKRREYVRRMNETHDPNEQELVQRVLRAATAFQKAEVLLRRGSLDEAEAQSQIAFENDPEQAEYAAFYADIVSQKRERTQQGQYADLVKMVNAARKREPQNLKVRIHRARVLRRSGDADGALREFRAVVEQDPSNVEAAREVRLFEMRRGKKGEEPKRVSAPDASSGGKDIGQLIGKWFKR